MHVQSVCLTHVSIAGVVLCKGRNWNRQSWRRWQSVHLKYTKSKHRVTARKDTDKAKHLASHARPHQKAHCFNGLMAQVQHVSLLNAVSCRDSSSYTLTPHLYSQCTYKCGHNSVYTVPVRTCQLATQIRL